MVLYTLPGVRQGIHHHHVSNEQATTKPVAVGFGISKPEHVKQVSNNPQAHKVSHMPKRSCFNFILVAVTGSEVGS